MYKILERTIDYEGLIIPENLDGKITHYGLFKVNYHNGKVSSVDSEDPINGWYESIDELVNNNPDVTIEKGVMNYQQTLIDIHDNRKKTLNNA